MPVANLLHVDDEQEVLTGNVKDISQQLFGRPIEGSNREVILRVG